MKHIRYILLLTILLFGASGGAFGAHSTEGTSAIQSELIAIADGESAQQQADVEEAESEGIVGETVGEEIAAEEQSGTESEATTAAQESGEEKPKVDVGEIVIGHLADSYEWNITSWGDRDFTIYLPVILKSKESGWHFFSSRNITKGQSYKGFYVAEGDGIYDGKIVEQDAEGNEIRPWDFSLTKTALGIWINSFILLALILGVARWYRKRTHESEPPKGFVGAMEMFIMMVQDDIIKPAVGKEYRKYAPYLLTAFFFIFLNNLMGLVPIFPGGANVTGNISVTLVLALFTFFIINIFGNREYWKGILWPDVPIFLKFPIPLMPLIEIVGMLTKPFALMVRLFANLLAGHAIILSLTALIFFTFSIGPAIGTSMTFVSMLFLIFMNLLELLVAFIQAYVFTMLSAVFIGMSRPEARKTSAAEA